MNVRLVLFSVCGVALLAGCLDRKEGGFDGAIVAGEAGTSGDTSSLSETKGVMAPDTSPSTGHDLGNTPGIDAAQDAVQDNLPDVLSASDQAIPDLSSLPDALQLGLDSTSSSGPDVARDTALDLGSDIFLVPDLSPDVPIGADTLPDTSPSSCVIGGKTYASGGFNPANACQTCQLSSPNAWTTSPDATGCPGSGKYCSAGVCAAGCLIGGIVYATGAVNASNACQTCQPTSSATAWTVSASGTSCATGQICNGGSCQAGCWIGGGFIGSGATNASNTCEICNPPKSTTDWSNNDAAAAVACGSCGGTAACINKALGTCSKTATTYYRDTDGDGYGDPATSASSCSPLSGYVAQSGDCDDKDNYVYPGGMGHCESYLNPNSGDTTTIDSCASNGTYSQTTCPNGCAGGQCRSVETVTVAGQVTCGAIQCSTSQGCDFVSSGGDYHPVCGSASAAYYSSCDGPSDCSADQACCFITGVYAHYTQCVSSSSCPYPFNQGLTEGRLVCNPNVGACPSGTCQIETASNVAWSIYTCR